MCATHLSHGIFRLFRAAFACLAVAISGYFASPVSATTVLSPEFPTLVNESDFIVHAVTKNVSAEKRIGPRGLKIFTRVEFEIIEVVAGTSPATLTLEFLGGRVGDEVMTVGGMPEFRVGDEDILFVRGNGQSICPLYAMMHGRYSVGREAATGRRYVARSDGTPLQSTAQVAAPLEAQPAEAGEIRAASAVALGPTDFVRQIKASLRPGARALRER